MAFCPSCRSEYRTGYQICTTCEGEIALVEELAKIEELTDADATVPVGITTAHAMVSSVDVGGGRAVDLLRVFTYTDATDLAKAIRAEGIPARIRALDDVEFPDRAPRFEVHVRAIDHARAEDHLVARWRQLASSEGGEVAEASDAEACPACGAKVPLDVEECPECGLVVGKGVDEGEGSEAGEAP